MCEKGQFPSWDAFAEEMRLIWNNAKEFNEEGSQIYQFAEALEVSGDKYDRLPSQMTKVNIDLV